MDQETLKTITPIFVQIIIVFAGILTVVLGGIGWIIKNKITSYQDKLTKQLQNNFERTVLEIKRNHEISKETYQEIFKKRINAYRDFSNIVSTHENEMALPTQEQYAGQQEGEASISEWIERIFKLIDELHPIIIDNQMHISQELWESFKSLYADFKNYTRDYHIADMRYNTIKNSPSAFVDEVDTIQAKYFKDIQPKYHKLLNTIEGDLQKIRTIITF